MPERIEWGAGQAPYLRERLVPQPADPAAANGAGGLAIAAAALELIARNGASYAYEEAPTSIYRNLSGNRRPGQTPLAWLRRSYKCNQFVGEALTLAGASMPTYRMADGSEHYVMAEELPRRQNHFDRLDSPLQLRPGDVIVIDYGTAAGASGAHAEIVISRDSEMLVTAGAHFDGAYLKDNSALFADAVPGRSEVCWLNDDDTLYLLRPRPVRSRSGR